ncbi:MAG: rod shape-determining protein MreC [Clostridiales bacterium]|jgi:rod shape-determining protein MreC|nr:rod shape-determining protein MreC [Clostridiales bacterium]
MGFFSEHKKFFITIGALLCAGLMGYSVYRRERPTAAEDALSYAVTPVQAFFSRAAAALSEKIGNRKTSAELAQENKILKGELDRLNMELSRLRQTDEENRRLTELLEMRKKYSDYPMIGVTVIAKEPGSWYDNFIIDKGAKSGLSKNMVLIAEGGLVGRVTESGYNYSKAKSLIDDAMAVSVKSSRTGDSGILKGDMKLRLRGLCRMERIDINSDIIAGDEIVTSNLGNLYPPGIKVGEVEEVSPDAGGLTKTATVRPFVDFAHLDSLLVIKETFDKNAFLEEAPENPETEDAD